MLHLHFPMIFLTFHVLSLLFLVNNFMILCYISNFLSTPVSFLAFIPTISTNLINKALAFHSTLLLLLFLNILALKITITHARGITIIFAPSTNYPRPKAQGNRDESWIIRLTGGRKRKGDWEKIVKTEGGVVSPLPRFSPLPLPPLLTLASSPCSQGVITTESVSLH